METDEFEDGEGPLPRQAWPLPGSKSGLNVFLRALSWDFSSLINFPEREVIGKDK